MNYLPIANTVNAPTPVAVETHDIELFVVALMLHARLTLLGDPVVIESHTNATSVWLLNAIGKATEPLVTPSGAVVLIHCKTNPPGSCW